MNFSITEEWQEGLRLYRIREQATGCSCSLLPDYGALLHEWKIPHQHSEWNLIDNYPTLSTLEQELALSYKSAKLSPFVCRITKGQYHWKGRSYEFNNKFQDGSAIHGLLFNKSFNLTQTKAEANKASLTLAYEYRAEDPGYPFQYACSITYTLLPDQHLHLQTTVRNLGPEELPIADGWHPYFQLGGTIDDCTLAIQSDQLLEFTEQLVPTGKLQTHANLDQPFSLQQKSYDQCFVIKPATARPVSTFANPRTQLQLEIFTDHYYPYLQVYTPPHRQSIALENLSSAPDCFNNKIGLLTLAPGQSQTFHVSYKASALR